MKLLSTLAERIGTNLRKIKQGLDDQSWDLLSMKGNWSSYLYKSGMPERDYQSNLLGWRKYFALVIWKSMNLDPIEVRYKFDKPTLGRFKKLTKPKYILFNSIIIDVSKCIISLTIYINCRYKNSLWEVLTCHTCWRLNQPANFPFLSYILFFFL